MSETRTDVTVLLNTVAEVTAFRLPNGAFWSTSTYPGALGGAVVEVRDADRNKLAHFAFELVAAVGYTEEVK